MWCVFCAQNVDGCGWCVCMWCGIWGWLWVMDGVCAYIWLAVDFTLPNCGSWMVRWVCINMGDVHYKKCGWWMIRCVYINMDDMHFQKCGWCVACVQKAMQDAGPEWNSNKKVVDLSKKDIRHSVSHRFLLFSSCFHSVDEVCICLSVCQSSAISQKPVK